MQRNGTLLRRSIHENSFSFLVLAICSSVGLLSNCTNNALSTFCSMTLSPTINDYRMLFWVTSTGFYWQYNHGRFSERSLEWFEPPCHKSTSAFRDLYPQRHCPRLPSSPFLDHIFKLNIECLQVRLRAVMLELILRAKPEITYPWHLKI